MNKTININLGGIFFHIDEIAYTKLKSYLDAIRRSLSDDPQGRDEILNDIELRIGELLSERIKSERQVINEFDINEITKIMGQPEDYAVGENQYESEKTYRSSSSNKKLFRDNEDKFLGGVCSGLSHYIGIETIWVRLIWLVLLFFFGTGILLYILLWILVPVAETTAEKLQMKGEPVNISNIEKKIREEFQDVTSRVKDGVNDVTDSLKSSEFKSKAKSGIQEIVDTLTKIILAILTIFGKFIGAILIFIAAVTLIALVFGAFSWGSVEVLGFGTEFVRYPSFFSDAILPTWLLVIFTFIAIGIPFLVLFMLGLKILSSNVKSFSTTTKLSLLGIWIIALLGLALTGINFATQQAYDGVHNNTQELPFKVQDTIKVKMIGNDNLSNQRELRRRYNYETVFDKETEKLYSSRINIDIKSTDQLIPFIKIRKESEGNNRLNANKSAEAIDYIYGIQDNQLLLNGYFLTSLKSEFKDQMIDITIHLPINYIIYLDESTKTFIDDIQNVQNIRDIDMSKNYFKMTEKGLTCLNCDTTIFGDEYRKENDHFNLNIDRNGVNIKVNDGKKDAEVKIDENGIIIK
ncbi:PspC domain-containing protein [Lutibacter sp.]|uniref:PspC domain-containing protein n=1 Tax=Lutibacter sp. TaxID=1925666 RepID=UPI002735E8EA|nr:PspC domain-containing protein [Lutibacter sp.]MDP3312236.1 PspC domain-containing protein [Lutibacter sp.]